MTQFNYKQIDTSKIQKIKLLKANHPEWLEYIQKKRENKNKTDGEKERTKLIQKHPKQFKKFKKDAEYALKNKQEIKNKIEEYRNHLRQASFQYEGENKFGNKRISTPATYDKNNIINKLSWDKTHINHDKEKEKLFIDKKAEKKVKKLLKKHNYDIVEEENFLDSTKFSIPKNYRNSDNQNRIDCLRFIIDKADTRNEILRFVWNKHLSEIDDFHVNRAEAYLRDLESENTEEPVIKKARRKSNNFENAIKNRLENQGFKDQKRVFKIHLENSKKPVYKEMDHHFKHKNTNIVVEIFTNRKISEKEKQLKNYMTLLRKTGKTKVKGLMITTGYREKEKLDNELVKQKISNTFKNDFNTVKVDRKVFEQ